MNDSVEVIKHWLSAEHEPYIVQSQERTRQEGWDTILALEEPVVKKVITSISLPDTSTIALYIKSTSWWILAYPQ